MKILIITLIIFSAQSVSSQKLNLNNSIGFNFNDNDVKVYATSINSSNSFESKNLSIANSLNHNINYSNKLNQNEFSNKLSVGFNKSKYNSFLDYQTNYSLSRNLKFDNLIGIGFGRKDSLNKFKIGYSYAILYQKISNQNLEYFRHSFRLKISQEFSNYSFISEIYYQPNLSNINNYSIFSTTKLLYKINSFSFVITDIFNIMTISNIKRIHTITFGLNHKFVK